jgi:hypothetical protein
MSMGPMVDLIEAPEEKPRVMTGLLSTAYEEKPHYPYGTSLSLDEKSMDKLNIKSLPEIGSMIHGRFMAKVTRISASADDSGDSSCLGLQITHMALENEETENDEKKSTDGGDIGSDSYTSKLYGKREKGDD